MKSSIFQSNELIVHKVAEILGYENIKEPKFMWFTKDIYTQSFFYLTRRFGNCMIFDDYKDGGVWNFSVKNYTIQAYLNSSWLTFIVFGNIDFRMLLTPYNTKYNRELLRKKDQIISLYKKEGESWTDKEKPIVEKLYTEFLNINSIHESKITQEEWNDKYALKWFEYLESYNHETIGVDLDEYNNKYGTVYQNSYTRHALKTLEQFLKNMLTPIWIRDVPYNIKGRISDQDAYFYSRYSNNIKIEFINDKYKNQ